MNKWLKIILAAIVVVGIRGSDIRAGARIDFSSQNQTYDWLADYRQTRTGAKFEFKTYFIAQSNLIKGPLKRWQENATLGFGYNYKLLDNIQLITGSDYTVNGLENRRVRTSGLKAGISFRPTKYLDFQPTLRADNKRKTEDAKITVDQGIGYGMKISLNDPLSRLANIEAFVSYDNENLSHIPSDEGSGLIRTSYKFTNGDSLSISFRAAESAKKYYSSATDNSKIAKQIKQEREGNLATSLNLLPSLRIRASGNIFLSRYLYRQTDELEQAAQKDNYHRGSSYKIGLDYNPIKSILSQVIYSYNKTSQDYENLQLDQETESGEVNFVLKIKLSERDSISAESAFGTTSYSNPHTETSGDNRDQQNIIVNGRYFHKFSEFLTSGVNGGGSRFHQVYMFGGRSANNNRNDTYILGPYTQWRPSEWLTMINTFEIQANYITFDFDRRRVGTNNRIFRRATARTDCIITLTERLTMKEGFSYRYEDFGQLIWDDGWQQAVSWDRKRLEISHRVVYNPVEKVLIAPFISWEKTKDFDHLIDPESDIEEPIEIIKLKDQQIKWLFELEFNVRWSAASQLNSKFSHRIRKFLDRPDENSDFVSIGMEYLF